MSEQNKKTMWMVIGAAVIAFGLAWLFFGGSDEVESVEVSGPGKISGTVIFDALKPEKNDDGKIDFVIRKHNAGEIFSPADMSVRPSFSNGGTWMIEALESGVSYDVQARLIIEGEEVSQSEIVTTTAPASDIDLTLTVTWTDLPNQSITMSQNKTIAGTLKISGYIPEGAFYGIWTAPARDNSDLQADEVDSPKFTRVLNNQPADVNNNWVWDSALAQVEYRIKAELYTATGEYIGTSDIKNGVVPQSSISLGLQSSATTEPTTETLSGEVDISGSYKSDDQISIQIRENGAGGFSEVDSFLAQSHRTWVYTEAKSGVEYDVRAVLQDDDGDEIVKSKQEHTTAPDNDVNLFIDTEGTLKSPTNKAVVQACTEREDGDYNVTLNFPGIDSAESYWIRVGSYEYSADRFNEAETPDNTGKSVNVTLHISANKNYYTDYAYTYCEDCDSLSSYSDFSPSLKFSCVSEDDEEEIEIDTK